MKKKKLEQQFYEKIGIKQFKKLSVSIARGTEKFFNMVNKTNARGDNNYFLPKNPTVDDISSFKSVLALNAAIHGLPIPFIVSAAILELTANDPSLTNAAILGLGTVVNVYCTMLQRYNNIRINHMVEKSKSHRQ